MYAPAPNDLVLMRFYIWVDGNHFCFPRDALLYHRHPCEWRLQLVFYPNRGDPFIGQCCLFGEVRSAGAAQKAPKNKRHFSGRKNSIRSTSSLDQLEHKDICKLARAMLSVGRSMLLLLWRTYTVKSLLSWIKPATDFQQPVIYLDPRNPVHAYVDMDTIKWELSSF